MNPNTFEISRYLDEQGIPKGHLRIDPAEVEMVEGMTKLERKGWARNQPCPCGSGKKFKKCCFNK